MSEEAGNSTSADTNTLTVEIASPSQDNNSSANGLDTDDKPQASQPSYREHPGYNPVDLNGLPADLQKPIKDRFDYFYRQVNDQKKSLNQYRTIAEEQSKQINELMSGMGTVVDHLQNKSFADTEATIRQQMRVAQQTGDMDALLNLQDKLIDIRTEKKLTERQQKAAPQKSANTPEVNRNIQPINTDDAVQMAVQNGEITDNDATMFRAWQNERDHVGGPMRAWADPSHPLFQQAFLETQSVFTNQRYASLPFDKKLEEVDRRMGIQKTGGSQSVMGGGLTGGGRSKKITLTQEQRDIAVKMRLGGPKAKSDAEHIQRYAQQLEAVKAKKGTR